MRMRRWHASKAFESLLTPSPRMYHAEFFDRNQAVAQSVDRDQNGKARNTYTCRFRPNLASAECDEIPWLTYVSETKLLIFAHHAPYSKALLTSVTIQFQLFQCDIESFGITARLYIGIVQRTTSETFKLVFTCRILTPMIPWINIGWNFLYTLTQVGSKVTETQKYVFKLYFIRRFAACTSVWRVRSTIFLSNNFRIACIQLVEGWNGQGNCAISTVQHPFQHISLPL